MIYVLSGGAGLNFKVVGGTARPANPTENTIWVNSDAAITSWVFSHDDPPRPVEGMVWILTWVESSVPFNALKKNEINLCPMVAKQYVNGAWVQKEVESYQNAAWHDWFLYIMDIAETHMEIAGVLLPQAWRPSTSGAPVSKPTVALSSVSGVTLTLDGDNTNGSAGSYFTSRAVDLTLYRTMKISVVSANDGGGYIRFGTTTSAANNYVVSSGKTISTGGGSVSDQTISIDISGLSGSHYLFVNMYGLGKKTIKFSKWWLEP